MPRRLIEVLLVAFKLGLTSFGGPVAHLGYFRDEYVTRRRWLDDGAYADLVALCQLLPGPVSSQVGIAVGMTRAGVGGGLAAWLGFTLPSAAAMILLGYGVTAFDPLLAAGWLRRAQGGGGGGGRVRGAGHGPQPDPGPAARHTRPAGRGGAAGVAHAAGADGGGSSSLAGSAGCC